MTRDGTSAGRTAVAVGRRTAAGAAGAATRRAGAAGAAGFFADDAGLRGVARAVPRPTVFDRLAAAARAGAGVDERLVATDCVCRDAARAWLFDIGRSLTFEKRVQGMHACQ